MRAPTLLLAATALAVLALALASRADAQVALKLEGTCERLVIAGRDLTDSCAGVLTNSAARGRTTFAFTAGDGQSLTFAGNGAQQDATEETDPLQPINLILTGAGGGAPTVAVGACRFSTPEPGKTAIACEASAGSGEAGTYAGTFVTRAQAAPGAPGSR